MKIKFYGVRGSLPVCGREFEKYGGNTTCIKIYRENAHRIAIIDAGTGIRNLGKEIVNNGISQNVINILFLIFTGIIYKAYLSSHQLITRTKE